MHSSRGRNCWCSSYNPQSRKMSPKLFALAPWQSIAKNLNQSVNLFLVLVQAQEQEQDPSLELMEFVLVAAPRVDCYL
jgi:hypothetical protein